jgi:hypothetical protein
MRLLAAIVVSFLTACAYQPGTFGQGGLAFPGARATQGCLDIAVDRLADLPDSADPVLRWTFGNRCDHETVVDLMAPRVRARLRDGRELALELIDGLRQIEPRRIDGRRIGTEAIAYRGALPADAELAAVCVDEAAIAHVAPEHWTCFDIAGPVATTDVSPFVPTPHGRNPPGPPVPPICTGNTQPYTCPTPSIVVGQPGAPKFGLWSLSPMMPHFTSTLGMAYEQFTSLFGKGASVTGPSTTSASTTRTLAAKGRGASVIDHAVMSYVGGGVGFKHGFYGGIEAGIGGLVDERETLTGANGPAQAGQSLLVEALGIAGWRARFGRISLGFEAAGGARSASYDFPADAPPAQQTDVRSTGAVLQTRVRAELWLTPWMTLGGELGASMLDRDEWLGGMVFGMHTRSWGNSD